jgi:ParB/RepB/Spo0J family partition protein
MRRKDVSDPQERAVWLSVDVLLRDEHQPRRNFGDKDLEELGLSIKNERQKQAVIVSPAKGRPGFYYITYGESRWRACKRKGINEVLCIIDYENEYDGTLNVSRVLGQAVENVRRVGHRHSELVRVISLVFKEEKEKQSRGAADRAVQRFADALGKSVSWAWNYLTLTNLRPDLLDLIDTKGSGLTFVIGVELARNDQDVQHLILEEAKRKNTSGQVQTLHKLVGNLSHQHRVKSGKPVRVRKDERRAAYFAFFRKIAMMKDHLVSNLGDAEFKKFEEECLSYGLGGRAQQILPQAKEVLDFLKARVVSLERSMKK